jgi:eukaryotic-like serine/threonine-protein kinase
MAAELKTLGRYRLERVLATGAMGVVYEGLDPSLNRRVAIKVLQKSPTDDDGARDYTTRFVREAQAVARLNHPHIVQVYDFGEQGEGIAYLVMEFIRGRDLKAVFDAGERFALAEALRIMCELLDALEFAHQAGIVHRDVKPANVMLDAQARAKLTDFGVARIQDADRSHAKLSQSGIILGTPAYMSPELLTGGHIDRRSDVFSAGVILYQFLTGRKPFAGGRPWVIAKQIVQEDPPLASSLNAALAPVFDAIAGRALAKDPGARYPSARELAAALHQALEPGPAAAPTWKRPPAARKSSSSSGGRSRTAAALLISSFISSISPTAGMPRLRSARRRRYAQPSVRGTPRARARRRFAPCRTPADTV